MHETDSQEDPTLTPTLPAAGRQTYAVFRNADFVRYLIARFIAALGMQMLSPTQVSLPFKLLLFVSIHGWGLLVQALVSSYRG